MVMLRRKAVTGVLLVGIACLALLLTARPVAAQGAVTPSFGDGKLTLVGEGYRPAERVAITVRLAGASHQFNATADSRGRFRLDTGLQVPPLSKVEIEARDEQGLTQATTTSAPAVPGGLPGGGAAVPGPAPTPPGPAPTVVVPTQLPRTGGAIADSSLLLLVSAAVALLGVGQTLRMTRWGRHRHQGHQ